VLRCLPGLLQARCVLLHVRCIGRASCSICCHAWELHLLLLSYSCCCCLLWVQRVGQQQHRAVFGCADEAAVIKRHSHCSDGVATNAMERALPLPAGRTHSNRACQQPAWYTYSWHNAVAAALKHNRT
jgi:hypothetical protein